MEKVIGNKNALRSKQNNVIGRHILYKKKGKGIRK